MSEIITHSSTSLYTFASTKFWFIFDLKNLPLFNGFSDKKKDTYKV